ncbi:MAG: flagellar basal body-associated FliL family protein [Deltaproteobacteria bacterium]|nr:flagellar basal body-associated FliL family protein [Deltaproteobacteria bacterium]
MAEPAKKAPESVAQEKIGDTSVQRRKLDILGIVLACLVALNVAGVVTLGLMMQKMMARMHELEQAAQKQQVEEEKEESPLGQELQAQSVGVLYPLEGFLVNLNSDVGPKFLQAQMELELADPGVEEELSKKKAAVRDTVIVLMSSRSYKELREPSGMKKLRADLVKAINNLLATGKIKEIYFTQFHFN